MNGSFSSQRGTCWLMQLFMFLYLISPACVSVFAGLHYAFALTLNLRFLTNSCIHTTPSPPDPRLYHNLIPELGLSEVRVCVCVDWRGVGHRFLNFNTGFIEQNTRRGANCSRSVIRGHFLSSCVKGGGGEEAEMQQLWAVTCQWESRETGPLREEKPSWTTLLSEGQKEHRGGRWIFVVSVRTSYSLSRDNQVALSENPKITFVWCTKKIAVE